MPFKKFLLYLTLFSGLALILHFLLILNSTLAVYADFSYLSIVFFIGLSVIFYYLGQIVSRSKNLYLFNGLVAFIVITKMTFCTLLIIVYFKKMHPPDKFFVVPFFLYYIIYTIFELFLMSKFAHKKIN